MNITAKDYQTFWEVNGMNEKNKLSKHRTYLRRYKNNAWNKRELSKYSSIPKRWENIDPKLSIKQERAAIKRKEQWWNKNPCNKTKFSKTNERLKRQKEYLPDDVLLGIDSREKEVYVHTKKTYIHNNVICNSQNPEIIQMFINK